MTIKSQVTEPEDWIDPPEAGDHSKKPLANGPVHRMKYTLRQSNMAGWKMNHE